MTALARFKTINGYGFVSNNPIMNTDPSGHIEQWLAYSLGGLSIGMAILAAVLLPVASAVLLPAAGIVAAGAGASAGVNAAVLGGVMGGIGVASGSLQIASTAHPENSDLSEVNLVLGIANGIATMAMGAATAEVGITSVAAGASVAASVFVTVSGISSAVAGGTGEFSSLLSIGPMLDPGLAQQAGWKELTRTLSDISMGFMLASIVSSVGSLVALRIGATSFNVPPDEFVDTLSIEQQRAQVNVARGHRCEDCST